jgi:CheY-like chemotaxis protein
MPHLDASTLERDVDGVALLSAALGIAMLDSVPEAARLRCVAPSRRSLQALVVESDRLLRESIAIQLHLRGHAVLEAETGEEALAMVRSGQALDVLLTEVETTIGPDGWALADEARLRHPSVAVLYTSAQPVSPAHERARSCVIEKPYRTERIVEVVEQLTSGAPRPRIPEAVRERGSDLYVLPEAA